MNVKDQKNANIFLILYTISSIAKRKRVTKSSMSVLFILKVVETIKRESYLDTSRYNGEF